VQVFRPFQRQGSPLAERQVVAESASSIKFDRADLAIRDVGPLVSGSNAN
jgi:hypothetical protein